jgi:hypothetical protein
VVFSVGWLGAVLAYLAIAITGLTSEDVPVMRAAYLSMELVGWFVIVPCAFAALVSGLVQSLGTDWGLVRHYWVLIKFLLTVGATTILLVHMRVVSKMAHAAMEGVVSADLRTMRIQLVVHAAGGLLVLLATSTLSIYKPWGRTRWGRRARATEDGATL